MSEGYISVCDWRKFQHYDPTKRKPPWIKVYTDLMVDDDFLALTGHQRSVLLHIWLTYASTGCHLRDNTASLSRHFNLRVMRRDIEALNHAGFITIVASKTLADGYQGASKVASAEVETEEDKDRNRNPTVGLDTSAGSGSGGGKEEEDWESEQDEQHAGFDLPSLEQRPNLEGDNGMGRLSPEQVLAARAREGA